MKFTVITPSYNQGQFLEDTILSVLGQGYADLEYIVIDGGSKDNSVDIIKQYEDRIDFWVSEPDKGQTDAINKGLRRASGDVITWINSDDQLTPGAINKAASYFNENPSLGLIHGKTIMFDLNDNEQETGGHDLDLPSGYLGGMCFPQPSSFFSRQALEKVGMPDESLHFGMDYDFFARIALQFPCKKTNDLYSKYLLHEASKTVSSKVKFADEWAKVFCRIVRSFEDNKAIIDALKELELYTDDGKKFLVDKPNDYDLITAFNFFMYSQMHFRYESYDLRNCRKYGQFLLKHQSEYIKSDPLLMNLYKRSALPAVVLKLLRKVKRC